MKQPASGIHRQYTRTVVAVKKIEWQGLNSRPLLCSGTTFSTMLPPYEAYQAEMV